MNDVSSHVFFAYRDRQQETCRELRRRLQLFHSAVPAVNRRGTAVLALRCIIFEFPVKLIWCENLGSTLI